jgi:hypothetical protein
VTTSVSTMVTDWFKANYDDIDFSVAREVKLKLYVRAPYFSSDADVNFKTYEGIADLEDLAEWVEIEYALTSKLTSSGSAESLYLKAQTDGSIDYLQVVDDSDNPVSIEDGAGWYFSDNPSQTMVSAAVFYLEGTYESVADPIVAATTQGIGLYTVAQHNSVYGQVKTGAPVGDQYAFMYNTDNSNVLPGYLLLDLADPIWESAHTHHLWIQPQRINFIANPSFERAGGVYWRVGRKSGTATFTRSGSAPSPAGVGGLDRPYCGNIQAATGSGDLVLESNLFPKVNNWYSVSFYVSGTTGELTFGLVTTDISYTSYNYIRRLATVPLTGGTSTTGFQKVTGLINVPDDVSDLLFRVEFSGTQFWIDNVIVDPHEGQYEYFDGNSNDGLPGDFRWMGGTSYTNKHFSTWYNNYVNTRSRLIGDYDTTDDLYKAGLVEEWAPTGASIIAHWDAVTSVTPINWDGDAFHPITELSGTPVCEISSELDFDLRPIT